MSRRVVAVVACMVLMVAAGSCSSDDEGDSTSKAGKDDTTTTAVERPKGPAADISEKLTGGDGIFLASIIQEQPKFDGNDPVDDSLKVEEYLAKGTATKYKPDGELSGDGRWTLEPSAKEDYATRIVVRRPSDMSKFSGTVLVEWLNVSAGIDSDPEYINTREELVRSGDIWVGVSAQLIGVEGGETIVPVSISVAQDLQGKGLKNIDPDRYGDLSHPGDAYSYDIFTQVARALREGGPALGGKAPKQVIAAGQSQSAFAMVTYINGVQPLTHAFDGFFVHSRGGSALVLDPESGSADIAGAMSGTPTIIRTDTDVPVMDIQTESDIASVLGSLNARQDDTDVFRLWEVAGTAHADAHTVGPTVLAQLDCGVPINDGPLHIVAKAAWRALVGWVRDGKAPPKAPRIEIEEGDTPAIRRDADAIALGGIRTPPLDVPTEVLSSEPGPSPSVICLLLGSTRPLDDARLSALYASRDEYQTKYDAAFDDAVAAGFVLEEDREALEAYAQPDKIPG